MEQNEEVVIQCQATGSRRFCVVIRQFQRKSFAKIAPSNYRQKSLKLKSINQVTPIQIVLLFIQIFLRATYLKTLDAGIRFAINT